MSKNDSLHLHKGQKVQWFFFQKVIEHNSNMTQTIGCSLTEKYLI